MEKKDYVLLIIISVVYITLLYIKHTEIFKYKFSPTLIEKYKHSQDITHDVSGRLFLSDGDIHIASGYLYAQGQDPTKYNFQHPPLIKYAYGLSVILFDNPFYAQVGFGILLSTLTYILGKHATKSRTAALIGTILFMIDPLLLHLSSRASLDLGQSALGVGYMLTMLFYSQKVLLAGVILGLFMASKFWGASLFFVSLTAVYLFLTKKLKLKKFIGHLVIAGGVFSIVYIMTFIKQGFFNIVFFELKTLKYWLNHSVTSIPGASLILFFSGYVKSWWDDSGIIRLLPWSILWPILLVTSIINSIVAYKHKTYVLLLISIVPLAYLLYLGIQAPFSRYFIIILPYAYISAGFVINKYFFKKEV